MAKAYKCDRCDSFYTDSKDGEYIVSKTMENGFPDKWLDLCDKCKEGLSLYLAGRPLSDMKINVSQAVNGLVVDKINVDPTIADDIVKQIIEEQKKLDFHRSLAREHL